MSIHPDSKSKVKLRSRSDLGSRACYERPSCEVKLIKRVVGPDKSLPFLNFASKAGGLWLHPKR